MRRNGHNTTSGIKSDHAIRSGMPENLYVKEILAKNAILWVFFSNVKFLPYSLHWRFSAHARKTGSCCPILMPNELVLTILVPNHRAKFGDDRLRIADARVVTDGQTDTRIEHCQGAGSGEYKPDLQFAPCYSVAESTAMMMHSSMHFNKQASGIT